VCLLGASLSTGNMGVGALTESSIKIILNRWPEAEISLLGTGYTPELYHLRVSGRQISIKTFPIRFSKNIFTPYHFLHLMFYMVIIRLLPKSWLRGNIASRNLCFGTLYKANFVADITAGDSFSDIYGFRRFLLGFLCKWLVISARKNLVLLPQTYGPFRSPLTRLMAKYILKRANMIFCRDSNGAEFIKNMLHSNDENGKIKFASDVAFILDAAKPADLSALPDTKSGRVILAGVNISGLLLNGDYTRKNMFGLRTNYRQLVQEIIELLLQYDKVVILLVPHVFPPPGLEVESDIDACMSLYEQLIPKYPGRIYIIKNRHNQGEIKHIIGRCDFFVGSRMHACIAALSQCIPAVGLAYSRKFTGVFESIGMGDCVADAKNSDMEQVLGKVRWAFENRNAIRIHLTEIMPKVKEEVLNIFNGVDFCPSDK
jgi:colanic acid/amylovoran biosynthesis protein